MGIASPQRPGELCITDPSLIAAPGAPVAPKINLPIRDGRVERIDQQPAAPEAEILDAGGRVVTAGFWNCHVHLTEPVWSRAASAEAPVLQHHLDDMFSSRGFTGAMDLGSNPRTTAAVISRIASGELNGPQLLTAGAGIYPPRGLPFYVQIPWHLRPLMPQPRTPAAARRAVNRSQRRGAAVAKLSTGSYLAPDPEQVVPMPLPVARAATEQAHRQGRPVFAHTSNREGLRGAVEAGVDVIAHVPDTPAGTEPLLREAARRGMRMIPTLDMFFQTVGTHPEYRDPIFQALAVFREAGGQLLFGTDVGYLPDRRTQGELTALETSGVDATEALAMLTTAPAELAQAGTGTVEPAAAADLVVLDHRELTSPRQLADVFATVAAGKLIWTQDRAAA
ncbi:amidohydrolase family protein [Nesterenkonia sp.]|uniref:amidohydrolase family protein n=1 Tax=Nesterenkonia sp. TaxID=704201 RepID=UPI00262CEDAE|nr:amidohydrolase family protein [Nesterenkonia sp.]